MLFAYRAINPLALHTWGMPLSLTVISTTFTAILLTTPLAWLSWRYIETPAISLGRTLGKQRPTLQVAS
jgi:peptidoglycan/LPS O-acetylase OafA/YrhL